jgi:Tfp pilus assembly protein PilX
MSNHRRGGALVIAMVTLLAVMLVAGTALRSLVAAHRRAKTAQHEVQALWLAEAALARARAALHKQSAYAGETWRASVSPDFAGVAEIRIEPAEGAAGSVKILVQARFPDREFTHVTVSREQLAARPEGAP